MTRLFRSKSTSVTIAPPEPIPTQNNAEEEQEEFDEYEDDDDEEEEQEEEEEYFSNAMSTPFISPGSVERGGGARNQFAILDTLVAALRKSLVTCSVEREDGSSSSITTVSSSGGMDISWPTQVKHVSHVTFDRFNGFLGLPSELQPELPRRVPSASATVFGVSAQSMQCSYDDKGNSVPTILLMMQRRLYVEGGLKAEGIFRINAENSQEEYVRDELNNGIVPRGIDVHCLAGLIKAWFRELPSGVLDSLTPEQVMHCNTEDDCTQLVKLLPPTEAALLNWAINLMADVAEHEQYNKMNARNIAMVFAPNMTQMADPLTALIHAVQVMNLLKTLILKTLRERGESTSKSRLPTSAPNSPSDNCEPCQSNLNSRESPEISKGNSRESPEISEGPCIPDDPMAGKFSRCATSSRLEHRTEENYWSFQNRSSGEEQLGSRSGSSPPSSCFSGPLESGHKDAFDNGDKLSLREGVRRLCSHPVFLFSKPAKKTQGLGIVNNRSGGGEAGA